MFSAKAEIALVVAAQEVAHGQGCSDVEKGRGEFSSCGPFGFGLCEDASLHPCNPYEDVLVPSSGSGEPPQGGAVEEGTAHGGLSSLCPPSGTTEAVGAPWGACALGTPSLAGRTCPLQQTPKKLHCHRVY